MGRGQRLGLIGVAVVIAVVAFIALRPSDDDDDSSSGPQTTVVETTATGETTVTEPAPPPKPKAEKVQIKDGAVVGGEKRITVEKGDVARIDISSDTPDEIHLHGYDVYKDVAPGRPAKFRVKADAEGIFELEAHDLGHVIVAKLVVEP